MRAARIVSALLVAAGSAAPGAVPAAGADPAVPPVGAAAAAAGFVDVHSVIPDAIVDLRYATANNFVGTALYPADARCLVHEALAPGLATAAEQLHRVSRRLIFWDCYRPHQVQVRMFQAVPDPNWVARPGDFARSHTAGRSVDVTIAGPSGHPVEMGTDFDDFSPRAAALATDGISAAAVANRAVLRDAMSAGGLAAYSGEWWHFDGPGAGVQRPILDVPVD